MDLEFLDRLEMEHKYKDYVIFHIQNVEDAFHRLIEPLKGFYGKDVDTAIDLCELNVPLHDLSKFSKFEFDPYRKHHDPLPLEKGKFEDEYEQAKQHHYSVNPHHPIYWGPDRDMPLEYIFEMLCDWSSVAKYYDSSVIDFWDNDAKKEKESLSPKTREQVDYWFDLIFRYPGLKY